MKKLYILLLLLIFQGCAPKLGKDIIINIDKSKITLDSSKTEVSMTIMSFIGLPFDKNNIKLSGILNIENKWWKDIEVKSINYSLIQDGTLLAHGQNKLNKSFVLTAGTKNEIPLILEIDTKNITPTKMIKRLTNYEKLEIEGTVVIIIFGKEIETKFKNKIN